MIALLRKFDQLATSRAEPVPATSGLEPGELGIGHGASPSARPEGATATETADSEADERTAGVLRRWAAFGAVQERVVRSLAHELQRANSDMERDAGVLSEAFQTLAMRAQAQSERVETVSSLAGAVTTGEETFALDAIAALFDRILADVVGKVEVLTSHAEPAKKALDEAESTLERIDACIEHVRRITRQTNMLAINARIEAARLGEAGKAFDVVANEMLELAKSTKTLSDDMFAQFTGISQTIRESQETFRLMADVDVSDEIAAKERLSSLIEALVQRDVELASVMTAAGGDAGEISLRISQIITSTQFQDRMSQRLEQVNDTLSVLGDAAADLRSDTKQARPDLPTEMTEDELAWLHRLASRYKLSEMRAKFVDRVIDGKEGQEPAATAAETGSASEDAGSVELF